MEGILLNVKNSTLIWKKSLIEVNWIFIYSTDFGLIMLIKQNNFYEFCSF